MDTESWQDHFNEDGTPRNRKEHVAVKLVSIDEVVKQALDKINNKDKNNALSKLQHKFN